VDRSRARKSSKSRPARAPAGRAKKPAPARKKPAPVAKKSARPAPAKSAPPRKEKARSPSPAPAAPPPAVETTPLRGDQRRHLLSLSFVRDGDEFMARLETDAGQITELKNRSLDQLLTLVAGELEDILE
jgi:hypothetical protein